MESANDKINNILALHFSGEKLTEVQEELLTVWVSQNQKEYSRLSELFLSSDHADRPKFNASEAWGRVDARLSHIQPAGHRRIRQYLAYAATVAVIVAVSIFFIHRVGNDESIYRNTTASLMTVILPDSSAVTLYPQSSLTYSSDVRSRERKTELEGKAFFQVSHNPYRPFIVSSSATSIRVLGTSFLVDGADRSKTGVYVREGVVKVYTQKEEVILKAAEQATSNGADVVKSAIEHPEKVFSKHIRQKTYTNTSLQQVIQDLEKEFKVQIKVEESLKDNRISTKLEFINIEEILSEISYICNIRYRKLSDKKYEFYKP